MSMFPTAGGRRSLRTRTSVRYYSPEPTKKPYSDQPSYDTSITKKEKERKKREYEKTEEDKTAAAKKPKNIEQEKSNTRKSMPCESRIPSRNTNDSGNHSLDMSIDAEFQPPSFMSSFSSSAASTLASQNPPLTRSKSLTLHIRLNSQSPASSTCSSSLSVIKQNDVSIEQVAPPQITVESNNLTPVRNPSTARLSSSSMNNAAFLEQVVSNKPIGGIQNLFLLHQLNPELFKNAVQKPEIIDNGFVVPITLFNGTHVSLSPLRTVSSYFQAADDAAKRIIDGLATESSLLYRNFDVLGCPLFQKPRISIDDAWDKASYMYGLMGPTVLPIILHLIKQQHLLEEKFANNPSALFCFTFMMVSTFHEQIMPVLSSQINVTHSWILHTLEQPFIRAYLNLVKWVKYFEPRMASNFQVDPSVATYKIANDFIDGMVIDPYAFFITDLKPRPFSGKNSIYVLFPFHSLKKDKLNLGALLFHGLNALGCEVQQLPYDKEDDLQKRYEEIKQSDPNAMVFKACMFLQESRSSPTFGSMCFSYDLLIQSFERSRNGFPNKLSIITRNSDGSMVNQDTLVNNNITPACLSRYYLEQISTFFKEFINSQQ